MDFLELMLALSNLLENSEKKFDAVAYSRVYNDMITEGLRLKMNNIQLLDKSKFRIMLEVAKGTKKCTKKYLDSVDSNLYTVVRVLAYLKQIDDNDYKLLLYVLNPMLG